MIKPTVEFRFVETPEFSKKETKRKKNPRKEAMRKAAFRAKMDNFLSEVHTATNELLQSAHSVERVVLPNSWVLMAVRLDMPEGLEESLGASLKDKMDKIFGKRIEETKPQPSGGAPDLSKLPEPLKNILKELNVQSVEHGPNGSILATATLDGGPTAGGTIAKAKEVFEFVEKLKTSFDKQSPIHNPALAAKETVGAWVKGKSVDKIKSMRDLLKKELESHERHCSMKSGCALSDLFNESITLLGEQATVNLQ